MQGWRVTNEDTHIANVDLPGGLMLFGVFDGHGGSEVAHYVRDKFSEVLMKTE